MRHLNRRTYKTYIKVALRLKILGVSPQNAAVLLHSEAEH